jgi:hypothetical protein
MINRPIGTCKHCGTVHPDSEIANPHYCIVRLSDQLEEKDGEIDILNEENKHLKEELEWKETGGVERTTGEGWLTTRMSLEAKILELTMILDKKDKEIEQGRRTVMKWIKVEDRLPPVDIPVLVLLGNIITVGVLVWEEPSWEETYEAYRCWDDPYNPGADWQWHDITHWMPLPELPQNDPETIEDGFGAMCSIRCPQCGLKSMQVVRPGKFQCAFCG